MLKMSSQIENIVNAYKTLAKIPSVVGAKLNNLGTRVNAKWSVRNLDKGKLTKYTQSYLLDDQLKVVAESDFGTDVSDELLSAVSPSERLRAVLREGRDCKDAKRQYLEVWRARGAGAGALQHCVDLHALDLHGDVYADGEFGSLQWSPDESAVVYVAERKPAKCEPYVKRQPAKQPPADGGGEAPPTKGTEYEYRQDWGEQLVGKHLSVVVLFELQTESCLVLEGLPETWCPGQVRFTADGGAVLGVAWQAARRLGLIFCTNRPSCIFTLTRDGNMTSLSAPGLAVRSPRARGARGARGAVWLQRPAGGAHHACHQLVAANDHGEVKTIIDIVPDAITTSNKRPFYGIYSQALPARCLSADGARVLFSTPQHNQLKSYVVELESSRLVELPSPSAGAGAGGSLAVLDVSGDVILATYSDLTTPAQLYVARLPAAGSEAELSWRRVSEPLDVPEAVATSTVEHMTLTHDECDDDVTSFTALYMSPRAPAPAPAAACPLVVWPHGGPHSAFVDSFSMEAAFYSMLGFASLQVNYRGSVGAGQRTVQFLLGRAGEADVADCRLATQVALRRFPRHENKLLLSGGSHGGFLVTHLSGQYPDTYRAVVARNPVTDVATLAGISDIPDCQRMKVLTHRSWAEAGFTFDEAGPLSEDVLLKMRRCSPIAHAHRVKAPTALLLGSGDRRVPAHQGLAYSRVLRDNGVPVQVYMYDDNHSLSSLPHEMDHLINGAKWFMSHLQ